MNLPIDTYPVEGAANENTLFATLGYFWTACFKDIAAVRGLTIEQSEELFQNYYRLLEAVNSHSASAIDVFNKIKWFPLTIKKSELNSNVLLFGEDVKFADEVNSVPYVFGKAKPEETNIYSIMLPEGLREINIITNRVISPTFILANNLDVKYDEHYLYFNGNPFDLPEISTYKLIDDAGNPVYYYDPLTEQPLPDEVLVLWVYHGKMDQDFLKYNLSYLFGVNLANNYESKNILEATVKLFSTGPNIHQLKVLCCSFLNIKPILEDSEIIQTVQTTATDTIITTDKHVYRYPLYYTLKAGMSTGITLNQGDLPVNAVEFYDNVASKGWWSNKIIPSISLQGNNAAKSPAMTMPPNMFVGNYKYGLTFSNAIELITRDVYGTINFPVEGNSKDVQLFQDMINENAALVASSIGGLDSASSKPINPLDYLFSNFLCNNSAMIKVNFETLAQLTLFTEYFHVIQPCLPKHVYFIWFFDTTVPNEVFDLVDDEFVASTGVLASLQVNKLGANTNHIVYMNDNPATVLETGNGLIAHNLIVRPIPTVTGGISNLDYNFLDITRSPEPTLEDSQPLA